MTMQAREPIKRKLMALSCTLLLPSCAHQPPPNMSCQDPADIRQACLEQLQQAMMTNPRDADLRMAYLNNKEAATNTWLASAAALNPIAQIGERAELFRQVLKIDPNNDRARSGLAQIERSARVSKWLQEAQQAIGFKDYATASSLLRQAIMEDPAHPQTREMYQQLLDKERHTEVDPALAFALQQPLSIEFKDASLKQVFDILARTSGINFVLDKDLKSDQRTTIVLKDVTVQKAIEVVTLANQLDQKVVDRKSIFVYANTAAKQKDFQAQTIRTFFLANSEAEQVANTLKTILKTRDVVVDKAQNMIIMRDATDVVRMAERIVALQDMPTPEAMLDIEVIEINRSRLSSIGINYPPKLSLSPLASPSGASLTLQDLTNLRSSTIGATVAPLQIYASATDGDIKLLAHPRIRIRNREVAKILIGDRVPNITSTSTNTGFVSENIQYLDVGLKVEATPVISIDNEVSIKIALEVSSIANQISTPSGTTAYQIGTRSASTLLRLKDGENQILAGLISDEDRRTLSKVPGLADIPLLGHLFGVQDDNKKKTEIVLSITPHILRNTPRPNASLMDLESGTESSMKMPLGILAPLGVAPKSDGAASSTPSAPAIIAPEASPTSAAEPAKAPPRLAPLLAQAEQSPGANAPKLSWSGPSDANVNTPIRQDLMLDSTQQISGINIILAYDTAALKVNDVIQGPMLASDGLSTTFNQRVDASTGQVFISIARPPDVRQGVTGQSVVASLILQALTKSTNTEPLRVQSITCYGPDNAPIAVAIPSAANLSIKVEAVP